MFASFRISSSLEEAIEVIEVKGKWAYFETGWCTMVGGETGLKGIYSWIIDGPVIGTLL